MAVYIQVEERDLTRLVEMLQYVSLRVRDVDPVLSANVNEVLTGVLKRVLNERRGCREAIEVDAILSFLGGCHGDEAAGSGKG